MMSWSCNTDSFPKGGLNSYADALKHWEGAKEFPNYSEGQWRPIGSRRCTNKKMLLRSNGDIEFVFYSTTCVVWHTDDSVTIRGYDTPSTSSFVDALSPRGVSHAQGSSSTFQPVLHLMQVTEHVSPATDYWPESRWMGPDWKGAMIIRCGSGIRLHYSADDQRWVPCDRDELQPFTTYKVDRKLSREVAKQFRLKEYEVTAPAAVRLTGVQQRGGTVYVVADALERGDLVEAINHTPVGGETRSYGRRFGGPGQINPGFLRELRDHVYEQEGAIDRVMKPVLTPNEYRRMITDARRYA
jgi:hypothetical protein